MAERPRKLRWWHVLIGCFVFLLVSYGLWIGSLKWRLSAELARLHEAGWPTEPEHLADWYSPDVPDDRNAFLVVQRANAFHSDMFMESVDYAEHGEHLPFIGIGKLPPAGQPLTDRNRRAIQPYLDENGPEIAELMKLADLPQSARAVDPANPDDLLFNNARNLSRQSAQHLALLAAWHTDAGDAHLASQAVRGILNSGNVSRQIPTLLDYMTAVAIDDLAADAASRLLGSGLTIATEDIETLIAGFNRADDRQALPRAVMADLLITRQIMRTSGKEALLTDPDTAWLYWYSVSGLFTLDQLEVLSAYESIFEALRRPDPIGPNPAAAFDNRVDTMPRRRFILHSAGPVPNMPRLELRHRASMQLIRAALAVAHHHATHGRLPTDLSQLVPDPLDAIPIDPYDGKPLRYNPHDTGYTLYSIGEDGIDNGGDPSLDQVLRIDRLPPAQQQA